MSCCVADRPHCICHTFACPLPATGCIQQARAANLFPPTCALCPNNARKCLCASFLQHILHCTVHIYTEAVRCTPCSKWCPDGWPPSWPPGSAARLMQTPIATQHTCLLYTPTSPMLLHLWSLNLVLCLIAGHECVGWSSQVLL